MYFLMLLVPFVAQREIIHKKKRRVGLHAKRSRNCLQPGSTARNLCQGNDYFDEKIFRQIEVKRTGRAGGGRRGQRNKQRLGGIWWVGHNLGNWEGALGYLMLAGLMDMKINNTFMISYTKNVFPFSFTAFYSTVSAQVVVVVGRGT